MSFTGGGGGGGGDGGDGGDGERGVDGTEREKKEGGGPVPPEEFDNAMSRIRISSATASSSPATYTDDASTRHDSSRRNVGVIGKQRVDLLVSPREHAVDTEEDDDDACDKAQRVGRVGYSDLNDEASSTHEGYSSSMDCNESRSSATPSSVSSASRHAPVRTLSTTSSSFSTTNAIGSGRHRGFSRAMQPGHSHGGGIDDQYNGPSDASIADAEEYQEYDESGEQDGPDVDELMDAELVVGNEGDGGGNGNGDGGGDDAGDDGGGDDYEEHSPFQNDDGTINPEAMINEPIDRSIDDARLIDILHWFYKAWVPDCAPEHIPLHLLQLYGPSYTDNALKIRHEAFGAQVVRIRREMNRRKIFVEGNNASGELKEMLEVIASDMFDSHDVVIKCARISMSGDKRRRAAMPRDETLHSYYQPKDELASDYTKLLEFYLDQCRENMLVKQEGHDYLLKPIFVDGTGAFTHTYTEAIKFSSFVHKQVSPRETHPTEWAWLQTGRNADYAAKFLENTYDFSVPFTVKNRYVITWTNGAYITSHDLLLEWDSPAHQQSLRSLMGSGSVRKVAAKYHPLYFDNDAYSKSLLASPDGWQDIPTPVFDEILKFQDFDISTRMWIYALFGRLLFPVGEKEHWQIQPFLKGHAGTGKSSLARQMGRVFDKNDIAIIGNNIQEGFGLEGVHEKLFYLALDINKDFRLDQTTWQSMVTGEDVSIMRKNRIALVKVWTSPGMLVGNVTPAWQNNSASVSRRVAMIAFKKVVDNADPTMWDRLYLEMPAFVKKITVLYTILALKYGKKSFWSICPPYFKMTQKELCNKTNTLSAFLEDSGVVVVQPGVWMSMDEFKDKFEAYCDRENKREETLNDEYYSQIFQTMGIVVERNTVRRPVCNSKKSQPVSKQMWLLNVCMSDLIHNPDNPMNAPEMSEPIGLGNDVQDDDDDYDDDDESMGVV